MSPIKSCALRMMRDGAPIYTCWPMNTSCLHRSEVRRHMYGIRERRRVRARTRIVLGAKGRQNARTGPCVHSAAGWFLREIGPLHPWVLMLRTLACAERCSSAPFGKRRIFSKIFSISNSIKQGLTHTGKRIRGEEIQNCEKL